MKTSFRGYDKKETDRFIEILKEGYELKIASLNTEINAMQAKIENLNGQIVELENKEKTVSMVLMDAIAHAREIETDYQQRARQSDARYKDKSAQWQGHIDNCKSGIHDMKKAAEQTYNELLEKISAFESWAGQNMLSGQEIPKMLQEENEDNSVDNIEDFDSDKLQKEILLNMNADLTTACKELGIGVQAQEKTMFESVKDPQAIEINQNDTLTEEPVDTNL